MHKILIAFEGGEGSGKTTASKALAQRLRERGIPTIWTREPGGSPQSPGDSICAAPIRQLIFELPTANAETMFGLFWAARAAIIHEAILPAFDRGEVVVCDRFDGSTWSYQLFGQEQPQLVPLFWQMRNHYMRDIWQAMHYLYFDINPKVGLARASLRGGEVTHFDEREVAFHDRIQEGYEQFWPLIREPCTRIDASQSPGVVLEQAEAQALAWIQSNGAPQ